MVPAGHEVSTAEARGAPEPDDRIVRSQAGGSGGGSGAPAPPAVTPAAPSASLALTGDSYTDSATESEKNIKFNATWSGGAKEDYLIVQWLKGSIKDSKGKPFKVQMYSNLTDFDFADWQIDSVDPDPAYWSSASGRWNYSVDAPDKFSATDSPGPVKASWGDGAEANVNFKTAVYKTADVPKTTTGTIAATPLSAFQPWAFHVKVAGGKFTH